MSFSVHHQKHIGLKNFNLTFKSPEIFAPAKIPVAAGKKIANTEKKSCFSSFPAIIGRYSGYKLSIKTDARKL